MEARDPKHRGLKPYQKGHPGGPGRPPHPPELKEAKQYTRTEIEAVLTQALLLSDSELKLRLKDPDIRVLDKMVYTICAKGIDQGDPVRLNFLLDRIIGKVKDPPQEVTFTMKLQELPTHEVIELGKEAVKFLEESKE